MILYLTSSPTGTFTRWDEKEFDGFNPANDFAKNLAADLLGIGSKVRCLMIAASPDAYEMNDRMCQEMKERLVCEEYLIECMDVCDNRSCNLSDELGNYTFIILGGGHVPTQNAFFKHIKLKEKLKSFSGIVMGISAGSMNCADIVYAQPEEEGESTDPGYERFISGLGLTDLQVIPHYNVTKDFMLDGKRVFEDITYPDSMGRKFYILTDGSYIRCTEKENEFCGEIYVLSDGKMTRK